MSFSPAQGGTCEGHHTAMYRYRYISKKWPLATVLNKGSQESNETHGVNTAIEVPEGQGANFAQQREPTHTVLEV